MRWHMGNIGSLRELRTGGRGVWGGGEDEGDDASLDHWLVTLTSLTILPFPPLPLPQAAFAPV